MRKAAWYKEENPLHWSGLARTFSENGRTVAYSEFVPECNLNLEVMYYTRYGIKIVSNKLAKDIPFRGLM